MTHALAVKAKGGAQQRRPVPPIRRRLAEVRLQTKARCPCGGACPACRASGPDLEEAEATGSNATPMREPMETKKEEMIQAKPADGATASPAQPNLTMGAPDDDFEHEADEVANHVMRMTDDDMVQPIVSGPSVADSTGEIRRQSMEEEENIQACRADGSARVAPAATAVVGRLRGRGRPLPNSVRSFFEPRFGTDFSQVRVHDGTSGAAASRAVSARAFTLGGDIAFAAGEFAPDSTSGRYLIAHELAHVVQQRSSPPSIQRRETPRDAQARAPELDFRPAVNMPPCACLVFVHNNERNARRAIQALQRMCRYNLAILGDEAARNRHIRVPGAGSMDPNELFPGNIRTECEADLGACRTEAADRDNLEATQRSYYISIRDCTNNFALPLVALHNNTITDTARVRRHPIDPATNSGLSRRFSSEPTGDQLSLDDLRERLRDLGQSRDGVRALLTSSGTTNIIRWCNLPEIGRCAIGDPANPDHVIWVVRDADFERLASGGFNVVQQTRASEGGESDTDLSTLLLGIRDARYINIETPHTVRGELDDEAQRLDNVITVLRALRAAGLNCCDVPAASEANADTRG